MKLELLKNMPLQILILVVYAVLIKSDWVSKGEIKANIYDPDQIWVANDGNVIVNDHAQREAPIQKIDFEKDEVIAFLKKGRGPGEVSEIFYKNITQFSDGKIFLWDAGLGRITVFNSDLEYITNINGDALKTFFQHIELINDSTVITFSSKDPFLKAWRMNDYTINKSDLLWEKSVKDFPQLSSLENPVMMQTLFFHNYKGVLYTSFEYSSLLMAVDEKGIKFITDGPDEIPIPDPRSGGKYTLPSIGEDPEGARDITVDDKYVYVVFSGENISKSEQMKYAHNVEALIERVKHAKRLWIFERESGEFIKEVELPLSAKSFQVFNNEAYLLNTTNDEPNIVRYQLPDDL